MVQGKHLWPPVPSFPCPLPGTLCPAPQKNRDPARNPLPLKGQSQVEGHGWKGDPSQEGCGALGSHK